MGWDIVYAYEYRNRDGKWEPAGRVSTSYAPNYDGMKDEWTTFDPSIDLLNGGSTRNYSVFGILSGARVKDPKALENVFCLKARGYPGGVNPLTVKVLSDEAFADTISWATLKELEEWSETNRVKITNAFGIDMANEFFDMVSNLDKARKDLISNFNFLNTEDVSIPSEDFRLVYGYNY